MNRDEVHNKPEKYGRGDEDVPVPSESKKENSHEKKKSKRFSGNITERKLERGYERRVK